MRTAVTATDEAFGLAESPVWDAARRRLLWVDILAGAVLEGSLDASRVTIIRRHQVDSLVGAVTATGDGTLLVAAREHLVLLAPDGTRADGPRLVPAGQGRRLNDGSTDPAGRFVVGTLSLETPSSREALVRLEPDGRITLLDDDLTLSNGLAWSADGTKMYSVDTLRRTVFVRSYDPAGDAVGPRRVHLRISDGLPDGLAADADEHLWIAVWGAGEVRRYAPDGTLTDRVAVPAPHTSSVAFAGDDLRSLVVTTAYAELTTEQRQTYPASGRLFTTSVDVPGIPVPRWSGLPAER
ncbi:SMP-30/gluconolactonase/LRE family protein [Frankia nepalensis]|uniref:SMP-30/gluconolactonase/LRE family protein n=1 Tax=Frankia nepalensis TaxID=1836974 RepID=A0A937R8E5_9ACTN|nr:SMP-30/gluconolactonase/LRE family protein [Frankia nepalensis]MBL7627573.1 SMP-30/gluconolactonase/LRE family protein [Frankia nepalensis]